MLDLSTPSWERGLSLCIQGTRFKIIWQLSFWRFIPVYTGNTQIIQHLRSHHLVYPCVYREHGYGDGLQRDGFGLSLCIQGTLPKLNKPAELPRFIPVYTGNTSDKKALATSEAVYPCVYREHNKQQDK